MMKISWDVNKAKSNQEKHGVSFADAATVLQDPLALLRDDSDHDEYRFVTIGCNDLGQCLVLVYTYWQGDTIRVISMRKATRREKQVYKGKRR
ncbi:BrnT family toxin [Magnetococcales bacterium HHB-1]